MEGWKLLRRLSLSLALMAFSATSVWALGIPSTVANPPPNPAGPTPTGEKTPPPPEPTGQGETNTPPAPPPNPEGSGDPIPDDVPPPPDGPPEGQAPEPATLLTASIGLGLGGLYRWRTRRRKS